MVDLKKRFEYKMDERWNNSVPFFFFPIQCENKEERELQENKQQ
jgi:hypothetical protein